MSASLTLDVAIAAVLQQRSAHARIATHAKRDFSHDGCRTDADVRYRRDMLRNIAKAYEENRIIITPPTWVTE